MDFSLIQDQQAAAEASNRYALGLQIVDGTARIMKVISARQMPGREI